jgi:tubulin-specific chaperone A
LEASVIEIEAALKNTEEGSDQAFKLQNKLIDRRLKAELNAIDKEVISQELKNSKVNLATQNALNERLKLNADYQEQINSQLDKTEQEDIARANKELQTESQLLESKQRAVKLNLELTAADEYLSLTERTQAKIKLLEMERDQLTEQENISGEERAAINKKYDTQIAQERKTINQSSVDETLQQFQGLTAGLTSIFEQSKQIELNAAGQSAEKRAAIEKIYAERVRAIRLFEIAASTAAAIIKQFADPTIPFGTALATSILVGATGALQLAAVAGQKFADGGYTGEGFGSPDETGYKVAGIVHEGEYVVPKRVVNNSPSLIGLLENKRLNGKGKFGYR